MGTHDAEEAGVYSALGFIILPARTSGFWRSGTSAGLASSVLIGAVSAGSDPVNAEDPSGLCQDDAGRGGKTYL